MQGGKIWILPIKINANRFFWDSYWLEIWSNHFCPSKGPNEGAWLYGLWYFQHAHFFTVYSKLFIKVDFYIDMIQWLTRLK
jgi:hypothetical protein